MTALLKALLSKPSFMPALALVALLAALLIGYRATQGRPPSPLEILRQDTLDSSYDTGYWTELAREKPELYQPALLYCVAHQARPNCQALRRQAFTSSLERSATAPPPPLQPAVVPSAIQATPMAPNPRPR
jgi:hypothetical protein